MKRSLIWLTVLTTLALTWLTLTDSGRQYWQRLFFPETRATNATVINVETAKNDGGPGQRSAVLIPAQPAPTEPELRVQVENNRTFTKPHDKLLVGLVVTDPQGRRSGIDSFSNAVYQEIPHSNAQRITSRDNSGNENEMIVVTVKPAIATTYSLEITGKPGGEYRLAVSGVSPTRESITDISQNRAIADTSVHYRLDLTKIKSLPFPGRGDIVGQAVNRADAFVSEPETRVKVSSYESLPDICQRAYQALSNISGGHVKKDSRFTFDGQRYEGCAMTLSGNSKTVKGDWSPEFLYPFEGSEMYHRGWKPTSQGDGKDGTSFRIENPTVFCLVSGSWDGGVDDDPSYIPHDKFEVIVECAKKPEKTSAKPLLIL